YTREHGSVYITIPPNLRKCRIKEIRILPKQKGRFLDAAFVYESPEETINIESNEAMSIDLGLNNLATVVSTTDDSFIIDGRWLKSKNQWFNKRRAKLVHHKNKQGISHLTKQEALLSYRRQNQVNNYLNKAARYIINFCLTRKIGTIIVGYNPTLKQNSNMGKRNNQTAVATTGETPATRCLNFVQIPIFTLRAKLESLCFRYGLNYVEQEESYTSKASSLDKDDIPIYNADNPSQKKFSGRRIKRGLYKTKVGHLINADCNGSLNIGFKSKHEGFGRVSRVCLTQPVRVQILQKSRSKSKI
ncbi:MAG: RNA-guided endonuclease InsQ/TnpB family protein, partial [Waterburya sp.]